MIGKSDKPIHQLTKNKNLSKSIGDLEKNKPIIN